MLKRITGLLLISISLTACYKDTEEELYPNSFVKDNNTYTFAADVKPIIDTKCASAGCHISGAQAPDLSAYALVKANIARVEARAVTLKTMPTSGALSVLEINKLKNWISAGALNN